MNKYQEDNDLASYFDIPVDAQFAMPTVNREKGKIATRTKDPQFVVPGLDNKKGGKIATRDARDLQVSMSPEIADQASNHLANLGQNMSDIQNDYDDMDGVSMEPSEEEPTTEIATRPGTELSDEIAPREWYSVDELPGNAQRSIKQLGTLVFNNITNTPLQDIIVMSTLSNPEDQVKQAYAGIIEKGRKIKELNIDFSPVMPGYEAQAEVWRIEDQNSSAYGYEFLLVKDFAGYYVYGYAAEDSKLIETEENPIKGYLEAVDIKSEMNHKDDNVSQFVGWVYDDNNIKY